MKGTGVRSIIGLLSHTKIVWEYEKENENAARNRACYLTTDVQKISTYTLCKKTYRGRDILRLVGNRTGIVQDINIWKELEKAYV